MAGLVYNGCETTGHSTYPPTTVIATQSKVFVEGIAACIEGDSIVPHTNTVKPHDTHSGAIIANTNKVYITGVKAAQIGDSISCGDMIAQSSKKVNI